MTRLTDKQRERVIAVMRDDTREKGVYVFSPSHFDFAISPDELSEIRRVALNSASLRSASVAL